MKALGARTGLYGVGGDPERLRACLEIVRVQVLPASTAAAIACTFGEVAFLATAAGVFVSARRPRAR